MKICVLGAGYVGLVVGVCIADRGFEVCCIDTNSKKIDMLKQGNIPIYEPGLDAIAERNITAGRLRFEYDAAKAIAEADIVYIAVGTPSADDGSADLSWVYGAAEQIGDHANGPTLVIIKSTVPVGTSDESFARIKARSSHVYDVVSNPEFLREGAAIDDFVNPDRIVVGYRDPKSRQTMEELYRSFIEQGTPIYFMENRSAELTKYAANALLATKISFINELAKLCERVGADVESVRMGTGSDSRIGPKFLRAGVGYGGSCFPKDVKALIHTAKSNGVVLEIGEAVERVNAQQKAFVVEKIQRDFGADLSGRRFAIWGLAFKPETDDIREAPALTIIRCLLNAGATVATFDPEATEHVRAIFGDTITYSPSPMDALTQADAMILVTEWNIFKQPDWSQVKSRMKQPIIYDGRNFYSPQEMREAGFVYDGIGRRSLS